MLEIRLQVVPAPGTAHTTKTHTEVSRQEKVSLRLHLNLKSNMPADNQTASIKHGTTANLSFYSFPMKKENGRHLTQAPKYTAEEHLAP